MAPHPIPLPCALAFPPPSHRDATTPSPSWAPHFMTQTHHVLESHPERAVPLSRRDDERCHTIGSLCFIALHACICQHGLYGCAHQCSKIPLRASVSETTLACIRFQVTKNQHLDPNIRNFGFYYRVFKTTGRDAASEGRTLRWGTTGQKRQWPWSIGGSRRLTAHTGT